MATAIASSASGRAFGKVSPIWHNQGSLSTGTIRGRGEIAARAGTQALSLLAVPFNAAVVRALADGPLPLVDLRRRTGSPPETTMRAYLRTLAGIEVVEKARAREFASTVTYNLTASGHDLLVVVDQLSAWLAAAPDGPIELGTTEAKSAIKALTEGWSTSIVRALAARPLSLTELDRLILGMTYPSLERRLSAMRLLRMVEPVPGAGRSTPYTATDWLRRAIAPLATAARWEQAHRQAEAPPITNRDIEASFLLTLPLLHLPDGVSGTCRLAVEVESSGRHGLVGVIARAEDGAIVASTTDLKGTPDAWVLGPAAAWFSAVIERDARKLKLGGKGRLGSSLVEGLNEALFGNQRQKVPD